MLSNVVLVRFDPSQRLRQPLGQAPAPKTIVVED